ncbi:TOBE domain-containing protein [Uruburuella testudinis]|uniref:TOBE domain-containing protein n=1 Tax=Uruburuella testudinis TaxID=1282863 RepID=A0ABY4DP31_9NEIS|nr:TOBE domain-containing protein [Uruburuella testudinis]UOO80815.1 TOBE domain-containing protein [Uruburuella testudinis]
MKTSARNQLSGVVASIGKRAETCAVAVALPGGQTLTAAITPECCDDLALRPGSAVIVLVKSTDVLVATDLANIKLSACNRLDGIISHIDRGAVNSVVALDVGGGMMITAGITMQSTEQLDLHPGQKAAAVFQSGSVILGVLA